MTAIEQTLKRALQQFQSKYKAIKPTREFTLTTEDGSFFSLNVTLEGRTTRGVLMVTRTDHASYVLEANDGFAILAEWSPETGWSRPEEIFL